jgi:hypothetical protein
MDSYSYDADTVNREEVEPAEIEIPALLSRRPAQAAAAKRRRRISPERWSTVRAHIAREHQALPPDSPRIKPSLPRLKLLGTPVLGSGEAA